MKSDNSSKQIVLASGNQKKIEELQTLFQPRGWQVIPQAHFNVTEAEETACTFVENAMLKARNAALLTGLPALADDSGLAVDALFGAPGIYSARYAGKAASDSDNCDKLLAALEGVEIAQRAAQYHAVLVFLRHAEDPTPLICHGSWSGVITTQPQGEGGFGYDPLFFLPELGCTAAQLPAEQKNRLSHRAAASAQLIASLDSFLPG